MAKCSGKLAKVHLLLGNYAELFLAKINDKHKNLD